MSKVYSQISMSLDGFITGPNVRVGNGMGDDGNRLHNWMFDAKTETDAKVVDKIYLWCFISSLRKKSNNIVPINP